MQVGNSSQCPPVTAPVRQGPGPSFGIGSGHLVEKDDDVSARAALATKPRRHVGAGAESVSDRDSKAPSEALEPNSFLSVRNRFGEQLSARSQREMQSGFNKIRLEPRIMRSRWRNRPSVLVRKRRRQTQLSIRGAARAWRWALTRGDPSTVGMHNRRDRCSDADQGLLLRRLLPALLWQWRRRGLLPRVWTAAALDGPFGIGSSQTATFARPDFPNLAGEGFPAC